MAKSDIFLPHQPCFYRYSLLSLSANVLLITSCVCHDFYLTIRRLQFDKNFNFLAHIMLLIIRTTFLYQRTDRKKQHIISSCLLAVDKTCDLVIEFNSFVHLALRLHSVQVAMQCARSMQKNVLHSWLGMPSKRTTWSISFTKNNSRSDSNH